MVTQNFYDSLKDAAQSAVCSYLNAADKASSWLSGVSGINFSDPSQYWKPVLCDEDPSGASNPPSPGFTGGQCPVDYDVTLSDAFVGSYNRNRVRGPICGVREVVSGSPGSETFTVIIDHGPDCSSQTSGTAGGASREPSIISVVRSDGQPDNCGDPPPPPPAPFPPGGDKLPPQPTTYIDFGGNTINISPEFTLFAPVVIGPNVFAPVKVDLPDVSLEGTLKLAPQFDIELFPVNFDGSPGTSDEPEVDEDPISSPNTPDDDSSETLIGVHVRSQESGYNRQTQIDQGNSPTLVVARLGRLYFRVRMGGRLGWLLSADIQHTSQYIPVPLGVYAIRAQAEWESGWSGEVIPVFGLRNDIAL